MKTKEKAARFLDSEFGLSAMLGPEFTAIDALVMLEHYEEWLKATEENYVTDDGLQAVPLETQVFYSDEVGNEVLSGLPIYNYQKKNWVSPCLGPIFLHKENARKYADQRFVEGMEDSFNVPGMVMKLISDVSEKHDINIRLEIEHSLYLIGEPITEDTVERMTVVETCSGWKEVRINSNKYGDVILLEFGQPGTQTDFSADNRNVTFKYESPFSRRKLLEQIEKTK